MKYTLPIILLLSGCSLLPSSFDSALYDHMVTLAVDVDRASTNCGTPAMPDTVFTLNRESKLALKYSEYTSKDTNASIALMDKAIQEMSDIYKVGTPTKDYCQIKLQIVSADLDLILTGIGGKSK